MNKASGKVKSVKSHRASLPKDLPQRNSALKLKSKTFNLHKVALCGSAESGVALMLNTSPVRFRKLDLVLVTSRFLDPSGYPSGPRRSSSLKASK